MARYAPSNPPTTPDIFQLERWLREEYEQVRGSTDDIYPLYELLRTIPMGAVLHGDVDDFTLNTTDSKLVNYTESAIWLEQYSLMSIDAAAGEITVGRPGLYRFSAHVIGDQGNSNKEEFARLLVDVNGARSNIWVRDIATDKTDERCFTGTFTRYLEAGDVVSLWMDASTSLGTFNTELANFEVVSMFINDPAFIVQPDIGGGVTGFPEGFA